jgi:hypothetical protein
MIHGWSTKQEHYRRNGYLVTGDAYHVFLSRKGQDSWTAA